MIEVDFSANAYLAHSEHATPPLRVGLLIEDATLPRFARQLLEDLRAANFIELACVVDRKDRAAAERCYAGAEPSTNLRAYRKLVDSHYIHEPHPFALVDCADLLSDIPAASEQDIDVYLCLGKPDMAAALAHSAKHGAWAPAFDGETIGGDAPPCLQAVFNGTTVIAAELRRVDPAGAGVPVGRITVRSAQTPSLSENQFNLGWTIPQLVLQTLRKLHQDGEPDTLGAAMHSAPHTTPVRGDSPLVWLLAPRLVRKTFKRIFRRSQPAPIWRIAMRRSATPLYNYATVETLRQFKWLEPPEGHFWADPFLLQQDGKTWLFFEDFSYSTRRGALAVGELHDDGELRDVRIIHEPPYHVSYPHVFRHDGEIWMIPESEQSHRIDLLRAKRFPHEWQFERTLLDLRGVDATPFEHDGRWWMFVSPMTADGIFPTTLLFTAPSLFGPWTLHPASPIATDVRNARCAGAIIKDGEQLLRPSQDCSRSYGYALTFNRIEQLDAVNYKEVPGARLSPELLRGLEGLHAYDRAGDWEVIDGWSVCPPSSAR